MQRHLTPAERATLQRITRGFAQLRALREIVEEVYRLFDRRCRTATALTKLARLRQRVRRFSTLCQVLKGLFSANLEKALTFLDDRLLGATSNAVERGNRRYRNAPAHPRFAGDTGNAENRLSRPNRRAHRGSRGP